MVRNGLKLCGHKVFIPGENGQCMALLFTLQELIDIIIMTLGVGYIFSSSFQRPTEHNDPVAYYRQLKFGFHMEELKMAIILTAPAVILHELMHKFVALAFGMNAVFHAAYFWLGLGVLMKVLNFGFIFFVPGYVSIGGGGTALQYTLTAFAGPFMNLVLWLGAAAMLKYRKLARKQYALVFMTSRINMFLFIFNMIPIPGFDGSKVFAGLIKLITG